MKILYCEMKMRESHIALILCCVSILLFLAALRPWLPFYVETAENVPVGNYEITYVTVKVTLNGKPVSNAKITVYRFWTPPGEDPANIGSPVLLGSEGVEKFTDSKGEVTFALARGNYTVRAEANNQWCAKNVEFKHQYADVEIDLSNAQQARLSIPLGYTSIIILCVASALMAAGVTIFIRPYKRS